MAKKLDTQSFFVFTEIWGALLIGTVWIARKAIRADVTIVTLSASVPFAVAMLAAMARRLADLRWPRVLLAPVLLMYVWLLGDNILFRSGWPMAIPRVIVAILGLYTGIIWLLISYSKGAGDD